MATLQNLDPVCVDFCANICKGEDRNSSALSTVSNVDPLIVDHASSQQIESINGGESPTPEEMALLRRVAEDIPWQSYAIAYAEFAERLSYFGCANVFTNFIQQPLPAESRTGAGGANGQSGALGMGQHTATALTTLNIFWAYLTTFIGAYLADTYWGRYKAILASIAVAVVGHVFLVISALPGVIERSTTALAVFALSVIVLGVGTGGLKTNVAPLITEQSRITKPIVREKRGVKVIVDPALTATRISMVSQV
jgi:POT family proton-dependent oligopeptide transporter